MSTAYNIKDSWPGSNDSSFQWMRLKNRVDPNREAFWKPDLILNQTLITQDHGARNKYGILREFLHDDFRASLTPEYTDYPRSDAKQFGYLWRPMRLGREQVQLISKRPYCSRVSPKRSWEYRNEQALFDQASYDEIVHQFQSIHRRVLWLWLNPRSKDEIQAQYQFRQSAEIGPEILLIQNGQITKGYFTTVDKSTFELSPECYDEQGRWRPSIEYLLNEIMQGMPDHGRLIGQGRSRTGTYIIGPWN